MAQEIDHIDYKETTYDLCDTQARVAIDTLQGTVNGLQDTVTGLQRTVNGLKPNVESTTTVYLNNVNKQLQVGASTVTVDYASNAGKADGVNKFNNASGTPTYTVWIE